MTPEKKFRDIRKELILLGLFLLFAVIVVAVLMQSRAVTQFFPRKSATPELSPADQTTPTPASLLSSPEATVVPLSAKPIVEIEVTPQSILVDDFDLGATSGLFKERFNALGSYQGTWAKRPSYTILSKSSTERRNEKGRGLVIDYYKDGGWCGYYNLLAGIDVSAFNTLSFWVKGEVGGEPFDIGLSDQRMQDLGIDAVYVGSVNNFLPKGVTRGWQEVKVPLTKIASEIDLTSMGSFVLSFRYEGKGRVYLEDIMFKDDPEVEKLVMENIPRAEKDPRHPRTLWVWNIDPAQHLKAREALFDLCDRTAVEILYLYIGDFSEKEDPAYAQHLVEFLRESHKRHLKVEALTGNPIWQFEENHETALQWVRSFLEFNKNRPIEARIDGISLDVEPYLAQEWNEDREGVKAAFLSLLKKVRALIEEYPDQTFRFGVVVPIFYDTEGGDFEKTIFETVDVVALMDYYDTPREMLGNALFHLKLADSLGKKVTIGLETQDLVAMKQGGRRNTFHEEGWEEMEGVLKEVAQEVKAYASFEGFAIHHYASYKNLQKGRNVPTKERKILYTVSAVETAEPLTIDGDLSDWGGTENLWTVEKADHAVYGQGAWKGKDDLSFQTMVRWDPDAFYLAVLVTDDKVVQAKAGKDLWEGDHIELWLDMDLEGDYTESVNSDDDFQFGLSPGNFATLAPETHLWTPPLPAERAKEVKVSAKKTEDGYVIEARLPATLLFATAKKGKESRFMKGKKFGISIDVSDTEDARVPQKCLLSTSTNRVWGDPTTFGILELK